MYTAWHVEMDQEIVLVKQLEDLKEQHRQLDHEIRCMEQDPARNELLVARHKKQKLALRDKIIDLESALYPDVPA
jgi:hypothetical protein